MKIVCAPKDYDFSSTSSDLDVVLFGHTDAPNAGSIGATARHIIQKEKLEPEAHAWDLLSLALSVIAADTGIQRSYSPDGWTREFNLRVAVGDPSFWTTQIGLIENLLRFLSTDIWNVDFMGGGVLPAPRKPSFQPDQDSVVLLSGGLDSFIGAIDLVHTHSLNPYAVSQVSQGDKQTQSLFSSKIGGGLAHLQLNHNVDCPGENERSQRARSIIFLAYGVLMATALERYHAGEQTTLYVCENGFISINPPLTGARLGSLSTRTTHPAFIRMFQDLLDAAGLRVKIENPYQFMTKGEMLKQCSDQSFLKKYAHTSTSCGRYARNAYRHCGRCLPCLIRRSAFHKWGVADRTRYVYKDLSHDSDDYARYDDVRSAAMAVATAKADGLSMWAGPSLSAALLGDAAPYRDVVDRGLRELSYFLKSVGVK